jgi:hypothetical protein
MGGIVAFLMYNSGHFRFDEPQDVISSTGRLISLYPLGLLIIPVAFTIIFPIISYVSAVNRSRNYNTERLDDELLVSLGVTENMLVLEEGRNRFNVAVSGPDVNNVDFLVPVPDFNEYFQQASPPQRERAPQRRQQQNPDMYDDQDGYEQQPAPGNGGRRRGRRGRQEEDLAQYQQYDDEG